MSIDWARWAFVDLVWHASLIELLWIASALMQIVLSRLNGAEAGQDLKAYAAVRAQGIVVNGRGRIASGNLRREWVRGVIGALFLMVGLIAAAAPDPGRTTLVGLFVSLILMMISWGLTLNSYWDRSDRLYLNRAYLEPQNIMAEAAKAGEEIT